MLPNDPPLGFVWNYIDPLFEVFSTFSADMDTSVIPPASAFTLVVDGVPKTPDAVSWLSARCMRVEYSEAALNPAVLSFQFPVLHDDLKYATGLQKGTWDIVGIEQTYDPEYTTDVLTLEVFIGVAPAFNDAVDPTPGNFELEDNNSAKVPDTVIFDGPTDIELVKAWGIGIVPPIRAAYESFDIRMVTATGLFTPFWDLSNIPLGG